MRGWGRRGDADGAADRRRRHELRPVGHPAVPADGRVHPPRRTFAGPVRRLQRRLGRFRGGLAQSTVLACAGFAAVSGSSLATAATMTKVAMPHMRHYGYDDSLSAGVIAAGGTLGIMIPPSVPLVIYGLVAEQDIGRLFIAGVAPGLLLVALYMAAVRVRCGATRIRPRRRPPTRRSSAGRCASCGRCSRCSCWCSAASTSASSRRPKPPASAPPAPPCSPGARAAAHVRRSYRDAARGRRTTAALFIVIFGAQVFSNFINLSGLPGGLVDMVDGMHLSPAGRCSRSASSASSWG